MSLRYIYMIHRHQPHLQPRQGFTLIELLVVIGIIVVLAGILIPTISIVRRMANDIKCGNNLQQIAAAIEVYKNENNDVFPAHLLGAQTNGQITSTPDDTSVLINSSPDLRGLAKKLFRCPFDPQNGDDNKMGRRSLPELTYLYDRGRVQGEEVGSSYLYETSGYVMTGEHRSWFFTANDEAELQADATWAMGKYNQLKFGSPDSSRTTYSGPFPGSMFPIIRCFWHYQWRDGLKPIKKVKNVAWELNVFNSTQYWEHDANPEIGY